MFHVKQPGYPKAPAPRALRRRSWNTVATPEAHIGHQGNPQSYPQLFPPRYPPRYPPLPKSIIERPLAPLFNPAGESQGSRPSWNSITGPVHESPIANSATSRAKRTVVSGRQPLIRSGNSCQRHVPSGSFLRSTHCHLSSVGPTGPAGSAGPAQTAHCPLPGPAPARSVADTCRHQ